MSLQLARRVGSAGSVDGVDIDATKVQLAADEAREQGVWNVSFRVADVRQEPADGKYDIVYARFLLTHLSDPAAVVRTLRGRLKHGGRLIIEDIDFSGHFTWPDSAAFRRYHELYCAVVRRKGGDPDIGPKLPSMLQECGFERIGVSVAQPMGVEGEVKRISALTMENIAEALLAEKLSEAAEIDRIIRELQAFASEPGTLAGLPRIVQTWGTATDA